MDRDDVRKTGKEYGKAVIQETKEQYPGVDIIQNSLDTKEERTQAAAKVTVGLFGWFLSTRVGSWFSSFFSKNQ